MSEQEAQTVPMKVICLGLSRTGTQRAIADTLEMLGYGTIYHRRDVIKSGHVAFWEAAVNAHFAHDEANIPTRADFDRILGKYQGVCDIPASLLVVELLDAYPDAQVLLTTRDVDKWILSMNSTLRHSRAAGRSNRSSEGLRTATDALYNHDFNANGAAAFHAHNRKVRDEVAKRGRPLLELDVSQPGALSKLCAFLSKEMPAGMTELPKKDEWTAYKKEHGTGEFAKEHATNAQ